MKQQKKGSNLPYILIGVVLIAAVGVVLLASGVIGAGWWLASSSKSSSSNGTSTAGQRPSDPAAARNAPSGAPLGVNMLGAASAPVTVEEFADYQCGACANTHPLMKEIQSAYAGNKNFRFVFRHYPLAIPGHEKAFDAARATEAAGMQGKFWQMQDLLFRNQSSWTKNPNHLQLWEEYAASIGLDVNKFKTDMQSSVTRERVEADLARGRGLGVNSTPTVLINGQMVPFPEVNSAGLRRAIDAAIQRSAASSASSTGGNSAGSSAGNSNSSNR